MPVNPNVRTRRIDDRYSKMYMLVEPTGDFERQSQNSQHVYQDSRDSKATVDFWSDLLGLMHNDDDPRHVLDGASKPTEKDVCGSTDQSTGGDSLKQSGEHHLVPVMFVLRREGLTSPHQSSKRYSPLIAVRFQVQMTATFLKKVFCEGFVEKKILLEELFSRP